MDSQLASVLTSGSLDVQNGSRCSGGSLLATQESPHAHPSPRGPAGNHHPSSVKTIRQDALSINGKKPAVGGTYRPASQETSKSAGLMQPIRAKTGGPARHSQPIRIKIVVPSHSTTPIRSSNMLLTKEFTHSSFSRPLLLKTLRNTDNVQIVKKEITEVAYPKTELLSAEDPRRELTCEDLLDAKIIHTDSSSDTLISSISADEILSQQRIKGESVGGELEENIPLCLQEIFLTSLGTEEQTEPLDLSLPKKRESGEQRYGRFLDDFGFESSLIMEVDEYDGEGDRDVVEEDNEHSLLSASFLSYSVDTQDFLFIDDQGIPYTLNPEGVKVPQIDTSSSYQAGPQEPDLKEPEAVQSSSAVQSLENALNTPCDSPPPAADADSAPPDSQTMITQIPQTNVPEPEAVLSKPSRISVQNQPLQILTSPTTNAPILLVSSSPQLSAAPLSLPLSVTSPGASTAMFLLLSSVPSSTGESTSTPIAVLDPSTGQLSQITAASAPLSLPLPTGPLSSSCPPALLPGLTSIISSPPLTQHVSTNPPQNNHSSLGTQAISGGDDSNEKPSTATTAAASTETQEAIDDRAAEPNSETETSTSEPKFDSEQLPLNDHIYFANAAASPSQLNLSPGSVDPQDRESHSPSGSPNSLASRRVLYCQLCPRVFFYLSDLERHAITHSQKKPHVCQQCGKAFKRSSHLQRHKHIHTGQRNFVCTICTKRFREAGELQRHQRVHTGEKPYQCQLCHTRFAERNTLRRHTKRKHPFHQAAVNMLSERSDGSGAAGAQEEEETAEWYSSAVSNFDNYDLDMES